MADTVDASAAVFVRSLNDGQVVINVQSTARVKRYRKCTRHELWQRLEDLDVELRAHGAEPSYDIRIGKGRD
jgi:hypothetical protein